MGGNDFRHVFTPSQGRPWRPVAAGAIGTDPGAGHPHNGGVAGIRESAPVHSHGNDGPIDLHSLCGRSIAFVLTALLTLSLWQHAGTDVDQGSVSFVAETQVADRRHIRPRPAAIAAPERADTRGRWMLAQLCALKVLALSEKMPRAP